MHRYSRFLPQPKASHTALRRLGVVLAIVVAGDVLALLVGRRGLLAVGPMLIDSLLVGLLAAQALVPIAHAGPLRRASLETRRLDRYTRPSRVWAWRAAAAVAAVAVVGAGLTSNADGTSFTISCPGPYGVGSGTVGPWPGFGYGASLLVALVAGAALVEFILAREVRRRRPDPARVAAAADDLRRAATVRAALGTGLALALFTGGEVALACFAELGDLCDPTSRPAWLLPTSVALGLAGAASLVAGIVVLASSRLPWSRAWS
jgi:hypothetical protein